MQSPFPILFAVDTGYVPHLATAIYSLLSNNKDFHLRIVLLTAGIPKKDEDKLKQIAAEFGVPFELRLLDHSLFEGLILTHHFTKAVYYRLFAAEVLKEDRCLYLDSDLIVDGSIHGLLGCDLQDQFLAAVLDPGFLWQKELGMSSTRYFNSGVMLINLVQWRKSSFKDTVISFLKDHVEQIRYPDQCAMNGVLDGKWMDLRPEYNYQTFSATQELSGNSSNIGKPIILHFTGSEKPWHMLNKHPYKSLYWFYRSKTPYKKSIQVDFSLKHIPIHLVTKPVKRILISLRESFLNVRSR